jgi:hypothetical protein
MFNYATPLSELLAIILHEHPGSTKVPFYYTGLAFGKKDGDYAYLGNFVFIGNSGFVTVESPFEGQSSNLDAYMPPPVFISEARASSPFAFVGYRVHLPGRVLRPAPFPDGAVTIITSYLSSGLYTQQYTFTLSDSTTDTWYIYRPEEPYFDFSDMVGLPLDEARLLALGLSRTNPTAE